MKGPSYFILQSLKVPLGAWVGTGKKKGERTRDPVYRFPAEEGKRGTNCLLLFSVLEKWPSGLSSSHSLLPLPTACNFFYQLPYSVLARCHKKCIIVAASKIRPLWSSKATFIAHRCNVFVVAVMMTMSISFSFPGTRAPTVNKVKTFGLFQTNKHRR